MVETASSAATAALTCLIFVFSPFSKKGVTEIVDLDMDHNIGK